MEVEKAFGKIEHIFMIKMVSKLDMEALYLNIIKTLHDKRTVNFILSGEKLKTFSL